MLLLTRTGPAVHVQSDLLQTMKSLMVLPHLERQALSGLQWEAAASWLAFDFFFTFLWPLRFQLWQLLSTTSKCSACPFSPPHHEGSKAGKRQPVQANAVNGIPRGGSNNCILSVASRRGKEAAVTVTTIDHPWPEPLLLQGLLETPLSPHPAANSTRVKGGSSAFKGQLAAFMTGLGGPHLGLLDKLQGSCCSWGQLHGAYDPGESSGGAPASWGGTWHLRDVLLLSLFPSISSQVTPWGCPDLSGCQQTRSLLQQTV